MPIGIRSIYVAEHQVVDAQDLKLNSATADLFF